MEGGREGATALAWDVGSFRGRHRILSSPRTTQSDFVINIMSSKCVLLININEH